jgi:hypothetical protein
MHKLYYETIVDFIFIFKVDFLKKKKTCKLVKWDGSFNQSQLKFV